MRVIPTPEKPPCSTPSRAQGRASETIPALPWKKREGYLQVDGRRLNIVDLPGTYSLTAYSQEELVARDYLINERPQLVIDIVDANSLERNLYLAVQFMEMGIPMVLALNMMDEVRKSGKKIDTQKLSQLLGIPVVETVARSGEGKQQLIAIALEQIREQDGGWSPLEISYGPDIDPVLHEMTDLIQQAGFLTDTYPSRWLALKYLENDVQIKSLGTRAGDIGDALELMARRVTEHCQATLDTIPEAIIADYRYGYIASVTKQGVFIQRGHQERIIFSDKIDRVLTHRFIGPLLMVGVLYGMFMVTFTVGAVPMGWLEGFFALLSEGVVRLTPPGLIQSMLVDGIIAGVGGVLGFVPLIMVMFMGIAFLEDSGYMARMAYMMDPGAQDLRPSRMLGHALHRGRRHSGRGARCPASWAPEPSEAPRRSWPPCSRRRSCRAAPRCRSFSSWARPFSSNPPPPSCSGSPSAPG